MNMFVLLTTWRNRDYIVELSDSLHHTGHGHVYFLSLSASLELGREEGLEVSFNLDLDCVLGRNDAAAGGSNPRAFWRESSHL